MTRGLRSCSTKLLISFLAGLSAEAGEVENLQRLQSLPREQRLRLAKSLEEFDRLAPDERRAVQQLDQSLAELSPTERQRYEALMHRYHLWVQGLEPAQQGELQAAPAAQRLELIQRLRAAQRQAQDRRGDAIWTRSDVFNPSSPFEVAYLIKVWLALAPSERTELEKLDFSDRLQQLDRLGQERGISRERPAELEKLRSRQEVQALKQSIAGAIPKARVAKKKAQVKDALARLEAIYLEAHEPEPVTPAHLSRFEEALPSWMDELIDPLPPDAARRRLTTLYRLVFPSPQEMTGPKPGAPSPKPAGVPPPGGISHGSEPILNGTAGGQVDAAEADRPWMRRALAEAQRGRGFVEPNPLVGAVVVRDGRLVSVGHHARFGGPHAEVVALAAAGDAARGASLYVTLEPCCHFGKTPPCTEAVIQAGIARVVAAMPDPFPKVAGGGFARLRRAGIAVETGPEADAARRLNAPYLKRLATGLPYVTAKWAMTLDGKTAAASGDSRWISGPRSRALVHELRGRMDAIAVGIGTALADDPELTARPPGPRRATRLVLDGSARLPAVGKLARTAREIPVWVAVTDRAFAERCAVLEAAGCELLRFPGPGPVPILPLLEALGRRDVTNLLVEGGGLVLGAFLDAGQVDAVDVFLAPLVEGGSHPFSPARGTGHATMAEALRLDRHEVSIIDGDVRLQGTIDRPWLRE